MSLPAVVLLSGGIDSSTTLSIARAEGFAVHAMTFRYGQRHHVEIDAAKRVAASIGVVEHIVVDIDLRRFGGSALTSDSYRVPKNRLPSEMVAEIPITYVPARNTIFLSYALAWAEILGSADIFLGVNAVDYSGYPDCRPEYIAAFQALARLATKAGVEGSSLTIHTPLIAMTKEEVIQRGLKLGVNYQLTSSCYDPAADGTGCGSCDSCLLSRKGFEALGTTDPRVRRLEESQA